MFCCSPKKKIPQPTSHFRWLCQLSNTRPDSGERFASSDRDGTRRFVAGRRHDLPTVCCFALVVGGVFLFEGLSTKKNELISLSLFSSDRGLLSLGIEDDGKEMLTSFAVDVSPLRKRTDQTELRGNTARPYLRSMPSLRDAWRFLPLMLLMRCDSIELAK